MRTTNMIIRYFAYGFAFLIITSIFSLIFMIAGGTSWLISSRQDEAPIRVTEVISSETCKVLKVRTSAARVAIRNGDELKVEADSKRVKIKQDSETLEVNDDRQWFFNGQRRIVIYVPKNTVFDEVSIVTGAGRVEIEELVAEELYIDTGAGDVRIGGLVAHKRAEIYTGAGRFYLGGGELHDADFDLGVGQTVINAALIGDSQIDCGVGEVRLGLIGAKDLYKIKVSKGLGAVMVDGDSVGDGYTAGDGENRVQIDSGVGSVKIDFREL